MESCDVDTCSEGGEGTTLVAAVAATFFALRSRSRLPASALEHSCWALNADSASARKRVIAGLVLSS